MFSCKDVSESASEYIDGNMPFMKRMNMRVHLFMCVHCRKFISQLKDTIRVVNLSKPVEPDEEQLEAQVQRLLRQVKKE